MTTPGWKTLNAYVDGELSPQEAAEVACAAGANPRIADQIALLYHAKSGAHAAMPPAPDDLSSLIPSVPLLRLGWRRSAAVAAGLAFACVLGVSMWWATLTQAPETGSPVFASARALHQRWLQNDVTGQVETTPVVLAALTRFGHLPVVPDLESTGLEIATVGVFDEQPDVPMLQIGYRGHHGCHLSLFVVADGLLPGPTDLGATGREQTSAWQVGKLGYLLFANGMDQSRFDLIAEKVERATRTSTPLSVQDRQQLAANHQASTRCQV